jgi:hypothetical protein
MAKLEFKLKRQWIDKCPRCKKEDAVFGAYTYPICLECSNNVEEEEFNALFDIWADNETPVQTLTQITRNKKKKKKE